MIQSSTTDTTFGHLLRYYRARAGLTQAEIAEMAGVSRRCISDLERGVKCRPHRYTIDRLTAALDLDATDRHRFQSAARPIRASALAEQAAHIVAHF